LLRQTLHLRVLCASVALTAGCATQADVQYVRQDAQNVRAQAADAQAMVQGLKHDVETLRGELEAVKFQAGAPGAREDLTRRLDALDARVSGVEQTLRGGAPVTSLATEPGTQPAPPAGAPGIEGEAVPANAPPEYRDGLESMRSGDYQAAIQKFREFLRKSPKSDLADNAQYWIGEGYYSTKDFNRAILEFNEVLLRYPKGDKVPAALLRQAYAFADLGDKVDARLVLQKLVSEHGDAPEAEKGRQKLAELSS
jgi:tol-pal system protein YbgF